MSWGFERGRVYVRRADIHARLGGQQQGGIITPAKHSVVIIITGSEGQAHGYHDRELPDGTFEYFGEGQVGDMQMANGNAAVLRHSVDGEDLLLFRKLKDARLRFEGAMVCTGYHIERAPDTEGHERDAIVFELKPLDAVVEKTEEVAPLATNSLDELRARAMAAAVQTPNRKTKQGVLSIIERSRLVRDYVVMRAGGKCEGCGAAAPFLRPNGVPYLEPHHIRRLTDGGPDDPHFVIGLCPNCHRRVHSGADGPSYNEALLRRMPGIEPR